MKLGKISEERPVEQYFGRIPAETLLSFNEIVCYVGTDKSATSGITEVYECSSTPSTSVILAVSVRRCEDDRVLERKKFVWTDICLDAVVITINKEPEKAYSSRGRIRREELQSVLEPDC
ncbi:hypothetical protein T01_3442 [Trichinella spiralis]|uniref:Uncharacterized protein n=1 Tax=Trichinella spiralis TaxID=6334 RepID=A0A0V1BUP3_TRISP|nr:hypothetical protein T01_3442 [Trichinella spiralis]